MPVRYCWSRTGPTLAYDIDIRVLLSDGFKPLAARNPLDIRIGIHTQTVQIRELNPPYSPLLEILQQIGVLKVHIRHRFIEPAAIAELTVVLRGIDIVVGSEDIIGIGELGELVDPIRIGQVFHPPMSSTAVIRHHVHQYLQSFLMSQLYHLGV